MKKAITFMMYALLAIFAVSCSDDDGDWERMKWSVGEQTTATVKQTDGHTFTIPKEGGTVVLNCTNYIPWISMAGFSSPIDDETDITVTETSHCATSWADVKVADHTLTVIVQPNATEGQRNVNLQLTAGDVFCYFTFIQL